ncbi:hypothetical protein HYH03_009188 [Edaphochlamys debaryana]|uniref:Protein kinase domain-containing protein n=1 Tax=Edaphochlamys debaryana TaxID=47281 RepID=A0A836BYP3_9CHLO|nr:hypothetical protein HYH03_009188 [Edaphochlamys debaryana]|eukprot:KAG2492523.1 hypothetical protein HYH03_009188 [Edaphochlamys debaryana]
MPTPPIAATEGLHRLQDCVSGLKVLRIRPGAALLVGTAVSGPCPGLPVVARLERGRPQQLLAPRLLAAAAGPAAGSPPHPNVVRTLGVHLVALPPEDADETYHSGTAHGDSGSIPGPSAAGTSPGAAGPSTLAHEAFSAPAGTADGRVSRSEAARGERGGGMGGDMLSTLAVAAGDLLGVGGEECAEDVTLTLTELVDGGCLRDEAARGAFACVLPGAAPPPAPVLRGEAGEAQAHWAWQAHPGPGVLPAALRDASLLSRAERLLDTALDVACGLQHLHADMGLAHGDLVSRNVLLKRAAPGDGGGGLSGNVAGGGGGAGAGSALRSSILCAGGSTPGTGSGYARVSATSVNRVNTVHVGLWRDVASLAPERLNDSTAPASHASDVYAYGVLLYEMAYGEQPWAGLTPASVVVGTATGELRLNCPQPLALPGISALLAACTSPSPELRPSVAALVDCVRGLREQLRAAKEAAAERQQQRQSNRLPGRDSTNA